MSSFSEVTNDPARSTGNNGALTHKTESPAADRLPVESRFLDLRGNTTVRLPCPDFRLGLLNEPANCEDTGALSKRTKPEKKAGKGKRGKKSRIDSRRGIDSLLRNAYRAQLDMLSLAAVKANIMISLNGLLISMLIISGTHIIGVDVWFAIPITLFLLSSALATFFAVLAARPDISRKRFQPSDFRDDKAHLLLFEEFSDLSEKEYVKAMFRMLKDDDRVYRNMISHVHELGSTADRKYRKLYCSYTVFISGIVLSIVSLLILEGMKWTNHLPPV